MSQRYILTQDDDSHWYVIPADKSEEFDKAVSEISYYWNCHDDRIRKILPEPELPDWAEAVGGSPTLVSFTDPVIG